MWTKQVIKLRVLVVEDEQQQREDIINDLKSVSLSLKQNYGISDFEVDEVGSLEEGLNLLNKAVEHSLSYHIVLLDLGIPVSPRDNITDQSYQDPTQTENGYEILEFIRQRGGAKGVIVLSIYEMHPFVRRAFVGGAVEFISKRSLTTDILQTQTLNAWMRVLGRESNQILQQRVKDLVPYLKRGLAHKFTSTFSELALSVSDTVNKIENYVDERYGLDPKRDTEDLLVRYLQLLKEQVRKANSDWADQQSALTAGEDSPKTQRLEELLLNLNESLLPCMTVKGINLTIQIPEHSETEVKSFQDDVYAVLREILLGAMNDLPDFDEAHNIKVAIESPKKNHAIVSFDDDFKLISEEAANSINEGLGIIEDQKLGREWGLSIAQHIAKRGGGQLEVKPQKVQGNIIKYTVRN